MLDFGTRIAEREPAPLLVFLHGSASSPRQWQPHMERLGWRYRVMAPALIGYGNGASWSARKAFSLRDEVVHLQKVLDIAPEGVHLVGHSYGGAVALQFALRHPQKVRSLTLYEPVLFNLLLQGGPDTQSEASVSTALRAAVQRRCQQADLYGAARVLIDYWSGDGAWEQLSASKQQMIAHRMPKVAAEFDAAFADTTPLARYGELRMPVQLVYGAHTRAVARRIARLLWSAMRRAEILELPEADHMSVIGRDETLCRLIDHFIRSQHDEGPVNLLHPAPRRRVPRAARSEPSTLFSPAG
jgi:pimeloyl-ACP methyl ester carboxylesterase